jgi:PmbA protein
VDELQDKGAQAIELAQSLGAEQVKVRLSRSSYTELTRRDGKIELAQESRSLGASVALLVDGRYSSHSTSDLRPEALREFLGRAVDATRFLEPDPDRLLPSLEDMGSIGTASLEADDATQPEIDPAARRDSAAQLEETCHSAGQSDPVRSISAYLWDGRTESAIVCSNGYSNGWSHTSLGQGATVSLEDSDGRLPEAYAFYGARNQSDLPDQARVARDALARARSRLGSGPCSSRRTTLLLENRNAGRILGTLLGPLSGTAIYEKRSCMADKLKQRIAPTNFSLYDDPTIPRAAGSRPYDGDGFASQRRAIVEDGVLQTFFLNLYNARRMGMDPTTGSSSNLILPPGERSPEEIAAELPDAIRVEGFLGGNANATSGDFSFGIHGTLLSHGEPVQSLSEMNISGNLFELMENYVEAANDPWNFGAWQVPTLRFDDIQFSGS